MTTEEAEQIEENTQVMQQLLSDIRQLKEENEDLKRQLKNMSLPKKSHPTRKEYK